MKRRLLPFMLLGVTGCFSTTGALRQRAAFDFRCPPEALLLVDVGNVAQQGVTGCGQRGTYVLGPNGWILNSANGHPVPDVDALLAPAPPESHEMQTQLARAAPALVLPGY